MKESVLNIKVRFKTPAQIKDKGGAAHAADGVLAFDLIALAPPDVVGSDDRLRRGVIPVAPLVVARLGGGGRSRCASLPITVKDPGATNGVGF